MQKCRALLQQMQNSALLQQLLRQNSYFALTAVFCIFVGWSDIFIYLLYLSGKLHDSISQPEYTLKDNSFSVQKKSWLTLTKILILTVFLKATIWHLLSKCSNIFEMWPFSNISFPKGGDIIVICLCLVHIRLTLNNDKKAFLVQEVWGKRN